MEVELKLEVTPAAAKEIETSLVLSLAFETAEQRSVYFDTPDHALDKAGLSLRVRRSGGKFVQTVKAAGDSATGLFSRHEWEAPLEGDAPVLDDTNPIRALLGDRVSEIGAVFEIAVERRTWRIEGESSLIELVLDRGEAVSGDGRSPICEIELELKRGQSSDLFLFARELQKLAPFKLGVVTKAERGYSLVERPPAAFKADAITITEDQTAVQAFQRIAQSCIRQFRLNEELLLTGRGSEPLHQMRVALRRLRSAFSIFRPVTKPDHEGAALRGELRWLASELGEARNLDVLLERIEPGLLKNRVRNARDASYDEVEKVLASRRFSKLMLDLVEWFANGDWLREGGKKKGKTMSAREFAAKALDRYFRKVRKEGQDLLNADDASRHETRKDAKKLRYASEFFAALFGRERQKKRYRNFVAVLEKLQDELGALNDLATTPLVLKKLGLMDLPGSAASHAPESKLPLLKAAAEAYQALIDAEPFWSDKKHSAHAK